MKKTIALALLSILFIQCSRNSENQSPTVDNSPIATVSDSDILRDTIIIRDRDTIIIRDTIIKTEANVFIGASKMNVMYIGVENPFYLELSGVSEDDVRVSLSGSGGKIRKSGSNKFTATFSQPGEARISVYGGGIRRSITCRIKLIPNPIARISNNSGGSIPISEFKAQGGVGAFLDDFDFDAVCVIAGFNLVYQAKRADPVESKNTGARFTSQSRNLINKAKPGDAYYFTNVRAKCPGDSASRKINSMVFQIR